MTLLSDFYAPRIRVPSMIQRGKTQTVSLGIYRDGDQVTPTGATYQLLNEDGTEIVSTSAAVIVGKDCQYTINVKYLPRLRVLYHQKIVISLM